MRYPRAFLLILSIAAASAAQTVTITTPMPVAAGASVGVDFTNDTASPLIAPRLSLLTGGGDFIDPPLASSDAIATVPPGATWNLQVTAPRPVIGTDARFFLITTTWLLGGPPIQRANVIDVGSIDPSAPICAFPASLPASFLHRIDPVVNSDWAVANASVSSVTLAGSLDVRVPGGVVSASSAISGLSIPAGEVATLPVPIGSLAVGAWSVRTSWTDPATGALQANEHGIQLVSSPAARHVDLTMPAGRVVPAGGSLPVGVIAHGFFTAAPYHYAILAFWPGAITVAGIGFPFAATDPLAQASVNGQIGAVVPSWFGQLTPVVHPLFGYDGVSYSNGISVNHPGPSVSGISIRLCIGAYEVMAGELGCSQGEALIFQ